MRCDRQRRLTTGAFTLVEVLVGVTLIGILGVALYLGMTQGFAVVQLARENLRATQVLQEKMEAIRLLTWDQYPTAVADTCKLVQLSWICSRTILGARVNTESVQSAKVVIRKK